MKPLLFPLGRTTKTRADNLQVNLKMGLFNSRAHREENNSFHAVRKKKPSHAKPSNRRETWVGFFFLDEGSISVSLFWNQSKALFLRNVIKKKKTDKTSK